ncbi:MAG: hypothetical protein H6Q14_1217 [Bacteroidetes bacterium]|jgi:murein DD-endopeptidase MepM/ murein hydrolase activator NlpD|nr:hypothetical protein [Bacteroidota bacterium]
MMKYNLPVTVKIVSLLARKIVSISFIAAMLFPAFAFGKVKQDKYNYAQTKVKYKQRHSGNVDALYADGIKIKRDLFMIDKAQIDRTNKADAVPSDKLYGGIWNENYVNCYKSIENFPDSFKVNLKGFTIPTLGFVTSRFGPRWGRFHYGIDLKVNVGDTIYAAFDGKVRVKSYERGGYGYFLVIRHSNGLETVYGHLSGFIADVDQNVKSGQPIALGGSTGRSTGPHLHFETRFLGRAIDPSRIVDFENKVCHRDYYIVDSKSFSPNRSGGSSEILYAKYSSRSHNKYTSGRVRTHRVSSGDTLAEIAQRNGTTVKKLCALNNISKRTTLRPGKTLRVR